MDNFEEENHNSSSFSDDIDLNGKVIPKGVKDMKEYKRYLKLRKDPLFQDHNRYFETSMTDDEGETVWIDLMMPIPVLRKKMENLPALEKLAIETKYKVLLDLRSKTTTAYNRSFGIRRGGAASFSQFILEPKTAELISLFGQYYTISEVYKIVTEDWGYDVGLAALTTFRDRFSEKIKEAQEKHSRDFGDLKFAHKKSRLQELTYLYQHRKNLYLRTTAREDYKLLLQTLRQINQEVEGDKIVIEGNIDINIQHTIDLQIQKEILAKTNIMDLVLSRVAAKYKINPLYLITKLHQSLYSQYSGFGASFVPADEGEVTVKYPSTIVYDFEKIRQMSDDKREADMQLQKFKEITVEQKSLGESLKDKIKRKMQQKRINDEGGEEI